MPGIRCQSNVFVKLAMRYISNFHSQFLSAVVFAQLIVVTLAHNLTVYLKTVTFVVGFKKFLPLFSSQPGR